MAFELKFKPILHTREDGTTYESEITHRGNGLQILKDIMEAPKVGTAMSLEDAHRYFVNMMWSDNPPETPTPDGSQLAEIFNTVGYFPKCLSHPAFNKHIVLRGDEYYVEEVAMSEKDQPPPLGPVNVTWMKTAETILEPTITGPEGLRLLQQLTMMPAKGKQVSYQEALVLWHQARERILKEPGGREKLAALQKATGGFPMVMSRLGIQVIATSRDFFVTLEQKKAA